MRVCVSACLLLRLCLSGCLSVSISVCLPVCLFVCVCVCLRVSLFVCLRVNLSTYRRLRLRAYVCALRRACSPARACMLHYRAGPYLSSGSSVRRARQRYNNVPVCLGSFAGPTVRPRRLATSAGTNVVSALGCPRRWRCVQRASHFVVGRSVAQQSPSGYWISPRGAYAAKCLRRECSLAVADCALDRCHCDII